MTRTTRAELRHWAPRPGSTRPQTGASLEDSGVAATGAEGGRAIGLLIGRTAGSVTSDPLDRFNGRISQRLTDV
jgi:hypothetical protein